MLYLDLKEVSKLNKNTRIISIEDTYKKEPVKLVNVLRRMVDIVLALIIFIVFSPIIILVTILIKAEDGGAAIYKHQRVKKNGELFDLYKFRTMKNDPIDLKSCLSEEEYNAYLINYKLENDPRVTKVGKILRKFSVDELPQIFNILIGDMTFIGPRPITMSETYLYKNNRAKLLSVMPGLTGYWQAYSRNDASYVDGKRQAMELYYIDNKSLKLDFLIVVKTAMAVIFGSGK